MRSKIIQWVLYGLVLTLAFLPGDVDAGVWSGVTASACQYSGLGESTDLGRSGYRLYNNSSTTRHTVICPVHTQSEHASSSFGGVARAQALVLDTHETENIDCVTYCRGTSGSISESFSRSSSGSSSAVQTLDMGDLVNNCEGFVTTRMFATVECTLATRDTDGSYSKFYTYRYRMDPG